MAVHRGGALLKALLVAGLVSLCSAQYNNRAYAITSATTWSTNPATNYNSAVLYRGLVYVWGNGSGPTMVAYQQYDFSGVAPDANRFCASGQPRFYVNYHDVCYAPTAYSQWQVDAPTSSWSASGITWNNQPSLGSSLASTTVNYMTYTSDYWFHMNISPDIVNLAVRQNKYSTGIRFRSPLSSQSCYETYNSYWWTYRSYIAFDYSTCDVNANCVSGNCVCKPGYSGNGISCAVSACPATAMGNANFPYTSSGSTSSGVCLSNYGPNGGAPTATCTNGVWGAVSRPCIMLTCAAETVDGTWFPVTNAGTSATGTCQSGWSGSGARACNGNGVWAAPTATCTRIYCSQQKIDTATFPSTPSNTPATGTCDAGYSGSPSSTCSASGVWGPVSNACTRIVCSAFNDLANNVQWPQTNALSTATGTCAAGFQGTPTRECTAMGAWGTISNPCVPKVCPGDPSFGNAQWPSANAGTVATGTCVSGYSGTPQRACQISGEWSATVSPSCVRNVCPAYTFANANWPANTLSDTIAVGTCVAGYFGSPSLKCSAAGTWETEVSNPCLPYECPAELTFNAQWSLTLAGSSNVNGACEPGYSGVAVRDCDFYGNWATPKTLCARVKCPTISEGNAAWPETDSFNTASGTCDAGFTGSPSRTCQADGTFSAIVNPCVHIQCPVSTEGDAVWPATNAGSSGVAGACSPGFAGSPSRDCTITGIWTPISGDCVQLTCSSADDADAMATFPAANAGSSGVEGECYAGTNGRPARDCFFNGTWSATSNPCSYIPCTALSNDKNANWPAAPGVSEIVTGECVPGYRSDLPPQRECTFDGKWSNEITNPCEPIYCTTPSPSDSFNAQWPASVQAGLTASGECNPGFTGTTSRSCSLDGVWGTPSPLCQAIQCPALPSDGITSWPATVASQTATGICATGYEGAPTRACLVTGQWSETVNDPCTKKRCLAEQNGNARWNETVGGSTATGACVDGYYGTVTRTCSIDGLWGSISGTCVLLGCPADHTDNINWPSTNAGSVASGSCDVGYGSPSATPTRPCSAGAVWGTPSGSCDRLKCGAAADYLHASWPAADSMTDGVSGTCLAGWFGTPSRNCSALGVYSTEVDHPCQRIQCAAVDEGAFGSWSAADAGTGGVAGVCPAGSTGTITRDCSISGAWSEIVGTCSQLTCSAGDFENANWPATAAGSSASGTCKVGFSGSPSRPCELDGSWGPVTNGCVQNKCPPVEEEFAQWPEALSGSPTDGVCNPGYFGSPSRTCDADGQWGAISDPCEVLRCAEVLAESAQWSTTQAGFTAVGECVSGFTGTPVRNCTLDGTWGPISNPCVILYEDCPAATVGMTYFPRASPGSNSTGNCPTGYEISPDGPPSRACYANGTWEEAFSNPCVLIPVENNGNIVNLTWVSKTSTSVDLEWDVFNTTLNSTFRVEIAMGAGSFTIANFGQAIGFSNRTISVLGLFPDTVFQFRVTANGRDGAYNDLAGAVISTKTYIPPAGGLTLSASTSDSLTLTWSASPLAQYYESYYRILNATTATRDASDGFVLSQVVDASAGELTISDLEEGRRYEVLILAGRNNETEQVGARLTTTTKSSTDNIVEDPSLGVQGSIIAGATAGAVVVCIIILVMVIVIIRRRRRVTEENLDSFGGSDALASLREYRKTLSNSRGSMRHADSTTHLSGADQTIVNTVLEVALPGFLRLEFNQAIQPKGLAGDSKRVEKATLLDAAVALRIGTNDIAVRHFVNDAGLSEEMVTEVFHNEVALMWSLSFHPNVASLVGYTDEPLTIVTRLYSTSLNAMLHTGADSSSPLEPDYVFHLVNGVASGLNAAHSMQVAHCNLSSVNILLQAPAAGDHYPTPVLSDFSSAHTSSDVLRPVTLSSAFVANLAPEAFAQLREPSAEWTLGNDMAIDVYAAGVIFWEIAARQVPFRGVSPDEIERKVTAGEFLQVPRTDDARVWLADLVSAIFTLDVSARPTIVEINSKLASLSELSAQ